MASIESLDFRGQPALALRLPQGDRVVVALHGAQALSWQAADGVERLYVSPQALLDGRSAIRGGVPVCWPQFNMRGPLVKHGFARLLPWSLQTGEHDEPGVLRFALQDSEASRRFWPEKFAAVLEVRLLPQRLRIQLHIHNTGHSPWPFTAALHTYLAVDDAGRAQLEGLHGAVVWDAVRDVRGYEADEPLRFGQEFDRVYTAAATPLRLRHAGGQLHIAQSAGFSETVVWNPGPALCAKLSDMPPDGWRDMLCVEAACIDEPVLLAPGARWQAWQELQVGD